MTIEITASASATRLGARRGEDELEREELRAQAADRVREALEGGDPELRHGDREVDLVDAVAGALDRLDQRAAREQVGVRLVEDAALRVAKAPEEQLQADRPVGDVRASSAPGARRFAAAAQRARGRPRGRAGARSGRRTRRRRRSRARRAAPSSRRRRRAPARRRRARARRPRDRARGRRRCCRGRRGARRGSRRSTPRRARDRPGSSLSSSSRWPPRGRSLKVT